MSTQSEFLSFATPTVVGFLVAIFSVWLTEWKIRRRFTQLAVAVSLHQEGVQSRIELAFENVGKHEARDCFVEWLDLDNQASETIIRHSLLNWTDNATGVFVRTIFPYQTAYLDFYGVRNVQSATLANQIVHTSRPWVANEKGFVDIEVSWHSGQMSRVKLGYQWGETAGPAVGDAWIESTSDRTLNWRNRIRRYNVAPTSVRGSVKGR